MDQQVITLANLMTAAGAGIAAVIITGFVQLLKQVFPLLDARVSGAALAFAFSALLYIWAAVTQIPTGFDQQLSLLIAWLTCATAAVGAYSTTVHTAVGAGVAALRSPTVAEKAMVRLASTAEANPNLDITVETAPAADPGTPGK